MKREHTWNHEESIGANMGVRFLAVAVVLASALLADLPRAPAVASSASPHVFLNIDSGEASEQPATF